MATGKTAEHRRSKRDSYLDLILRFPLRPIHNDRELDSAICVIDSLIDREDLDPGEADYLDVLGDLVSRYESRELPTRAVSDAAMLGHLLEAKGVTQAEAARATRIASSTFSEILAGKRKFTRVHIVKLAEFFNVSPAGFYCQK